MNNVGSGEAAEETLFANQTDVRLAAEELHMLLVFPSVEKDKVERPRLPNVEEMAEYECTTLGVLKDVIEQARRLGYDR